jgi:hypothetical protein
MHGAVWLPSSHRRNALNAATSQLKRTNRTTSPLPIEDPAANLGTQMPTPRAPFCLHPFSGFPNYRFSSTSIMSMGWSLRFSGKWLPAGV